MKLHSAKKFISSYYHRIKYSRCVVQFLDLTSLEFSLPLRLPSLLSIKFISVTDACSLDPFNIGAHWLDSEDLPAIAF